MSHPRGQHATREATKALFAIVFRCVTCGRSHAKQGGTVTGLRDPLCCGEPMYVHRVDRISEARS